MKRVAYLDIAQDILELIVSGEYDPGSKVSSVRELALQKNVNPKTVQKAFEYLDDLNALYTVVGEGRFVTKDEGIIEDLKSTVLENELSEFISKMKRYDIEKDVILKIIKEKYE